MVGFLIASHVRVMRRRGPIEQLRYVGGGATVRRAASPAAHNVSKGAKEGAMDASLSSKGDALDVSGLVRSDRVHRRVYQDPDVFELEIERIFGRAWVYVGHDSQIPKPGDFVTTFIGREPVIFCRHSDGEVYVLHNRCPHRGASVCNLAGGNTGRWFRCPYHGWTFNTDGRLHAVAMRSGYGSGYQLDAVAFGLARVPRVAQYEGFTFASLAPDGAAFELPPEMRACIDCIVERAPDKAVEVTGGVHRYQFRGNWKAQIENALDHYHPPSTHESTAAQDGRQFARRVGEAKGSPLVEQTRGPSPRSDWDDAEAFAFDGGHGYEGPMPGAKTERSGEVFERYKSALLRTNPKPRVENILKNELFHNAVFYPNMNLQLRALYIRVVRPVSVDLSEVNVYPIRLKGAPEEMFREQIRFLNLTHSASSLIQTDDVEMFRRVEVGLRNSEPEWVLLGRGLDSELPCGSGRKSDGTGELAMRNQFKAWVGYMSGAL